MEIKETLQKLGYTNLKDYGKEYRTKPLYRDSDNKDGTVLCIYKDSGYFCDFGREGVKGPLEELVRLTLNLKNTSEARKWLGKDGGNFKRPSYNVYVEQQNIFKDKNLDKIIPNHDYWSQRGISKKTLKIFKGGVDNGVEGGRFQNRYVFPIFNLRNQIIGFSGRKLEKKSNRPKWLHLGKKSKWLYPVFSNSKVLGEKKEVILVESIGDMLSLWEVGVKNVITLFGINLSKEILYYLLKISPQKIIISLNNDGGFEKAGNKGARNILKDLNYYFDEDISKIVFPSKNDFNEMSKEEIFIWKSKL